jgi:hypothetical protein
MASRCGHAIARRTVQDRTTATASGDARTSEPRNERTVLFQIKSAPDLGSTSASKVTNLTCPGYGLMLVPSIIVCVSRANDV